MLRKVIATIRQFNPSVSTLPISPAGRASPSAYFSVVAGLVSLCIIFAMIIPQALGLQSFAQWAGMYTDGWCNAWIYSDHPDATGVQSKWISAGIDDGTVPVWSAPMHNRKTCALWFRKILCGEETVEGWTVRWARPHWKGVEYLRGLNACELTEGSPPDWFVRYES